MTFLDELYMPFTQTELLNHFPRCLVKGEWQTNENYLKDYIPSIKRYQKFPKSNLDGKPLSELRKPLQIQKDEKFWTIQCLLTWLKSEKRVEIMSDLLSRSLGEKPNLQDLSTWDECLTGELDIIFEAPIPSPPSYGKQWLPDNIDEVNFIPYIKHASKGKKRSLEGTTYVDAVLVNKSNGFGIFFESKVLSDISTQISYDSRRNQIARNIDVMLESNPELCPTLSKRNPSRTLFVLLTPRLYQKSPSRLYWYKMHDYVEHPQTLKADLPHRESIDINQISSRIGWLTWEDFHEKNSKCCPWIIS